MLYRRIFNLHYVKVDKYRHYSQHYPVASQWSKCQSLQIISSQCLETRTVIYRSIFLVFFKISFHNTRLPLPLVSWRVRPTDESAFLVGLSHLGNSLRSTYQKLPGYLLPTCPGIINTKRGGNWKVLPLVNTKGQFQPRLVSFFFFLFKKKKKIYFLNNNKCTWCVKYVYIYFKRKKMGHKIVLQVVLANF